MTIHSQSAHADETVPFLFGTVGDFAVSEKVGEAMGKMRACADELLSVNEEILKQFHKKRLVQVAAELCINSDHMVLRHLGGRIRETEDVNVADTISNAPGTALVWASGRSGKIEIIRALIDAGADPNTADGYDSALVLACAHGHSDIMRRLLDAGADPNFVNVHGNTVLVMEAAQLNEESVRTLLENPNTDLRAHDQGNRAMGMLASAQANIRYHSMARTIVALIAEKMEASGIPSTTTLPCHGPSVPKRLRKLRDRKKP